MLFLIFKNSQLVRREIKFILNLKFAGLLIYLFLGFGKTDEIHKLFVSFLNEELGDYAAPPALGWDTTLDAVSLNLH